MPAKILFLRSLRPAVHLFAAIPLILIGYQLWFNPLAFADPVEYLTHFSGENALRLLLLSLAVTPIAKRLKQPLVIRLRRPLGLWCFAYASLHLGVWLSLDLQFQWALIGEEIVQRNYLLVGFAAWAIMLPLAITSLPALQRALGNRWKKLHHWVYLVALLAPLHFIWSVKSGLTEPLIYLAVALVLLSFRYRTLTKYIRAQQ
ncbi:protein-methionine-sulfoxide reductase heme-binding subunit MsrQ [Aurantivibrio plasticivorans]